MVERGSDKPADAITAYENVGQILREGGVTNPVANRVTDQLRKELRDKGLKGFKKGGKVKKTGVYKLHAGEKVVPAHKAKQEARDKKLLQKTRFR